MSQNIMVNKGDTNGIRIPSGCIITGKQFTAGCYCSKCENVRRLKREYKKRHPNIMRSEHQRYYKKYSESNKQKVLEALGGVCAVCGFKPEHSCQMDLHELQGRIAKREKAWDRKSSSPSNLLKTKKGYFLIMEYLNEVVPLCRSCHNRLNCNDCKLEVEEQIKKWILARPS